MELTTGPVYSADWIPYWNTIVRLAFFLIVTELICQLHRANFRLKALARQDPLTGIANVRVFKEYAQRAIFMSQRSGRPFTVAMLDLDEFKQVNDRFGHSSAARAVSGAWASVFPPPVQVRVVLRGSSGSFSQDAADGRLVIGGGWNGIEQLRAASYAISARTTRRGPRASARICAPRQSRLHGTESGQEFGQAPVQPLPKR